MKERGFYCAALWQKHQQPYTYEQKVINDIKFIRDGYRNLAEYGADKYTAVSASINCDVEIKTNGDLYSKFAESLDEAAKALEELALYKEGGLCLVPADIYEKQCKELDELKEKQTAKKVETEEVCGVTVYSCPVCEMLLYNEQCYCDGCGQHIDWSEEG